MNVSPPDCQVDVILYVSVGKPPDDGGGVGTTGGVTTGGVITGGITIGGVAMGGVTTVPPVRFTVIDLSALTMTDVGVGFTVNVNVPEVGVGVGVITGGVTTGGITTGGVTTGGMTGGELPSMIACIPRVMAISPCPQNL